MIQRIQTLYLLTGAVLVGAAPFAGRLDVQPAASLGWFVPAVGIALALTLAAGGAAIFLYGNRPRQRVVVMAGQVLAVITVGIGFAGRRLAPVTAEAVDWSGALLLLFPAIAYVLFWLARRAIEKDIALVRSMDRLR